MGYSRRGRSSRKKFSKRAYKRINVHVNRGGIML